MFPSPHRSAYAFSWAQLTHCGIVALSEGSIWLSPGISMSRSLSRCSFGLAALDWCGRRCLASAKRLLDLFFPAGFFSVLWRDGVLVRAMVSLESRATRMRDEYRIQRRDSSFICILGTRAVLIDMRLPPVGEDRLGGNRRTAYLVGDSLGSALYRGCIQGAEDASSRLPAT